MRYLVFLVFLGLILTAGGQTGRVENGKIIQLGEFDLRLTTSAPLGADPLTYDYMGDIDILLEFMFPGTGEVISIIHLSMNLTVIGDQGELFLDLSTEHFVPDVDYQFRLRSFILADQQFTIDKQNLDQYFVSFEASDSTQLTIQYGSLLFTPLQVGPLDELTFTSFTPILYPGGSLSMADWEDILPLFTIDTIFLPISAVAAGLFVTMQKTSIEVQEKISEQVEKVELVADKIESLAEEHDEVVVGIRATKEVTDFAKDSMEIRASLKEDRASEWLTRWGKLTLALYILLLFAVLFIEFNSFGEDMDDLIRQIYTSYTAFYLGLLAIFTLLTFVRISILSNIGKIVPPMHIFLIVTAMVVFVIYPLNELVSSDVKDILGWRDVIFLSLISFGFVTTSLFAGYYLARAGISWSAILDGILRKIRVPVGIRKIFTRLLGTAFIVIVFSRLIKTLAVIMTVLLDSELSSNAYLVSLAATYLKDEMDGPLWLVYGLIIIFFIQAIMSIYLHIRRKQVEDHATALPVYRSYRHLALLLLVTTIGFLHLIYLYDASIEELGLNNLIYPQNTPNSIDVWKIIFGIPPFRILLDILLALGLLISLPAAFVQMWQQTTKSEKERLQEIQEESEMMTDREK